MNHSRLNLMMWVIFITALKRRCGKVMFLYLSYSHSVRGGGRACTVKGGCMVGGVHGKGVCLAKGGGMCGEGGIHGERGGMCAGETATEAGGMYPSGMHPCPFGFLVSSVARFTFRTSFNFK